MSGLIRALDAIEQRTEDIFALELDGIEIIFRLPGIRVAQQYLSLLTLSNSESERSLIYEAMFRRVIEDDWLSNHANNIKAGIPETIAKLVLKLSGLDPASDNRIYTEQLINTFRSQADNSISLMKRTICSVFNGYTFESLDLLNYQNLVSTFIQAERILLERGIMEEGFSFKEPEKAKEAPFRVEDMIKNDRQSFKEYNAASQEDPRKLAHIRKLREQAKERAEKEELNFRKKLAR